MGRIRKNSADKQRIAPPASPSAQEDEGHRPIDESLFLHELREGRSVVAALRRSGADWSRIQQRLKDSPEFSLQCLETQDHRAIARALRLASLTDDAIALIEQSIINGDTYVALEVLKEMAVLKSASVPAVSRTTREHREDRFSGFRLLIIEDEEPLRRVMGKYLREAGYDVKEAGTAEEALFSGALSDVYARRPDLDCMMFDVNLPGLSGIELANIISDTWPATPVILISGDENQLQAASELGRFAACVHKPFELIELEKIIANSLSAA